MAQRASPLCAEDDVKGVDVLEDRALGEDQQVGVAAGADRRVGAQRAVLGVVLAGGEELAFILRPLLAAAALPGWVELEERELRERAISSSASILASLAALAVVARGGASRRPAETSRG